MATETFQPPASVSGLQRLGTIAAIVGVVLAAVGFALGGLERFYQAYLVAYTFWLGVALGSMALLMVQHLSGGAWGVVIRRPLEAAVSTHAGDGGAVPADRARHAQPLSLDARRRR